MSVSDGEIEKTPALQILIALFVLCVWNICYERIDPFDCAKQSFPQNRMPKPGLIERGGVGIVAHSVQCVQKDGERPLTVGVSTHAAEPFLSKSYGKISLDVLPAADIAIVHPHEAFVMEWVAVGVRKGSFGGGTDMGEDQIRCCFGTEAMKIYAIPSRYGGSEYARFWTQRRRCVIAKTEAITVVRSASVLENVVSRMVEESQAWGPRS